MTENKNNKTDNSSAAQTKDFERFVAEEELRLKQAELRLKTLDLEAKLKEQKTLQWLSSPLIIAIIGLIGAGVGALWQGYWNNKAEQQKFESTLILKAIDTSNQDESKKNLLFLVNSGLVPSLDQEKISKLAEESSNLPTRFGSFKDSLGNTVNPLEFEKENIISVYIPQLKGTPLLWDNRTPFNGVVRFHKNAAKALIDVFNEIEAKGLTHDILSFGGAYVREKVSGPSNVLSAHALGIAIDINAQYNKYGQPPQPAGTKGSVYNLVPIFKKHGFRWGGDNATRPDGMHFEYILPENAK